ncbi:speckle targeted PIP5K1A-regulated poly(A) polymerase [Sceloporus undulatus]|uniref:speckle targeted PIP5K1A-regulated poly(A) polymerase n=1 Tax=Sceloporus undulatus TaxID=8520 RepID=UPI001C4C8A97|nr:speckle targeted PIP5K1A-regulated poly(A) polymerase [Sceloporus undulatus]
MAEPAGDVEALPRGGFRCCLCRVTVANKPSLDDHLRGKKHQHLENLRSIRQTQELRSVFVSGFSKGTPASELSDYFQAYGEVINVVMDKDKGVYAIVELQNEEMLKNVLAQTNHSLGGQKLRVKPREKKDFKKKPPRKQGSARQQQLNPEKLAQKLCEADDVDAQMSLMVQLFEFSESERRLRDLVVTLFQEVFLEFFPGSAILPFGSSVNSFDVSGCDLDLFLDLEKAKHFQASAKGSSASQDGANPKLDSQSEDSLLSDVDLTTATVPEVLELVATVLQKCVPGVHNVQAVLNARRPVVKFCHKESGLRGDISINNRLALCNTRFLQLCTEADERVRPLVYVVRYWAKQQVLAGNPFGGGPLLNNYALTLLVLFFLQTRSPPVLPTVARLRELLDDEEQTTVDGWDCSFPKDSAKWDPSRNKESLCSLLAEFFHVFEDYDFSGCVISLQEGQLLPLSTFLSSEVSDKFKIGSFNLQDPFELSHNVAANVNKKTAQRFQLCCRSAAKYCRSLQYQRKSTKGKIWGLVRLFQPGNLETEADTAGELIICLPLTLAALPSKSPEHHGGDFHQLGFQKVCAGVAFVLRDVLKCSCLETQGFGEELASNDSKKEEEQSETKNEPLAAGFKRSLDDGEEKDIFSPFAKRPRTEALLPSGENMTWDCSVWHHVWQGRRRVRRQLHALHPDPKDKAALLELEAKVSEAISQQKGEARPVDPLLRFIVCAQLDVDGTPGKPDTHISLRFTPVPEQAVAFKEFFHFLQHFLPRMVEHHLASQAEPQVQ